MRIRERDVAVVTGAGGGIGRATAETLAARGCWLVIVDQDPEGLDETAERITSGGGRVSRHRVDVSDRGQVSALAKKIEAEFEKVRVLVNNAGLSLAGPVESLDLDDLEWDTGVNFLGMVYGCHFFMPLLRRSSEAWIVNVLSELALFGCPGKAGYSASKFAARGFSESLSAELAGSSVGVTCVYPGATATDLVRSGRAVDAMKQRREVEFLERWGRPPDQVARRLVRGIERGRRRVLVGADVRAVELAARLAPGWTARLADRVGRRFGFG